jgi:hypothetical protein
MITLDYLLDTRWASRNASVDLAGADEMTLRYDVLLGDVIFIVNEADFSAKWGWVPIVDFAACLRYIVHELHEKNSPEDKFVFTESDATICFKREGSEVNVSTNYTTGEASVPLDELRTAIDSFAQRVNRELCEKYPALSRNEALRRLLSAPL